MAGYNNKGLFVCAVEICLFAYRVLQKQINSIEVFGSALGKATYRVPEKQKRRF